MQVAQTILRQLGGNKFIAMTGSYNFASSGNALTMKLRRNKIAASHLRITLNAMDTYDMEFLKCGKKGIVVKHEAKGVYNDSLQAIFTEQTGLYTSLGTMGR